MEGNRLKEVSRNNFDINLLFAVIALLVQGIAMIYSATSSSSLMKKQILFAILGILLMFIIGNIFDYHFLAAMSPVIYACSIVIVILVRFIGKESHGQKRWIEIAGIQFQPTELVKISVILCMTFFIVKSMNNINKFSTLLKVAFITALGGLPVMMNNLSSGIIIFSIPFIMTFIVCRKKIYHILIMAFALVTSIYALPIARLFHLKNYQIKRILVWKSPELYKTDGGFQVLQGLYAVGSGGIFGKGIGGGLQKNILPEAHNDMIFGIFVEEAGLIGAVAVCAVFMYLIYKLMLIANSASDICGFLIVVGVIIQISVQLILNISVVTNVIPNTGITLPFMSYGGSSVIIQFCELGLVLSVAKRRK